MGDVHNGTFRELKKAIFSQFANLWLESHAKLKTKPSTFRSYHDIIRNHLIPVMGEYLLTKITTAKLQRYVALRLAKVKPKTVINEIVPIKELFKHAVRWGYLRVNPTEYLERPRTHRKEIDILTLNELREFLKIEHYYRIAFLTGILTGVRAGKIWGLQWPDVNLDLGQIFVKRSLWKGQFQTPKSKCSVRKIDLPYPLVDEMKYWQTVCPKNDHGLVFPSPEGKMSIHENVVKRYLNPALKNAGLRRVSFHSLRHTNASLRIEAGQNIKYIQLQMGHTSIQTTLDRYGHLIREVNTEQVRRLEHPLGFGEHDSSSDTKGKSVRRMLEDSGKIETFDFVKPSPVKPLEAAINV
jgi:integrase